MLITLSNLYKANNTVVFNDKSNFQKTISSLNQDVFVKQANPVTFKGENDGVKRTNVADAIVKSGIQGGIFLSGLAVAVAMAKMGSKGKDMFLEKDGFLFEEDGNVVKSSDMTIDSSFGVFKMPKIGINIDHSRFDYSDPENGVYKNFDKGIDIDLLNNKYIDPENGILVDPENKISSILFDHNLVPIGIPSFGIHWKINREPEYVEPVTRQEFIKQHGMPPEEYNRQYGSVQKIIPNDNRTMLQKIKDLFVIDSAKYNTSKEYDIFGRELCTAVNSHGDPFLLPLPDPKDDVFRAFRDSGETIQQAAEHTNNHKLMEFIKDYKTTFEHNNVTDHIPPLDHNLDHDAGGHSIVEFLNNMIDN